MRWISVQKKKSCKILDKEFIDDMHWMRERERASALWRCQQSSLCGVHAFVWNSFIRLPNTATVVQSIGCCRTIILFRYHCCITVKCWCSSSSSSSSLLLLQKGCQALGKWNKPHLSKTYKYHFVCLSGVETQMNRMDCTSHTRVRYAGVCVCHSYHWSTYWDSMWCLFSFVCAPQLFFHFVRE